MDQKDYKNVIGVDFQGRPIFKMNLREILLELGAQVIKVGDQSFLALNDADELLEAFPRVFEDDGMGYGVNERLITSADKETYTSDAGDTVFNIFAEPLCPEEVEKFLRMMEEDDEVRLKKSKNRED